MVFLFISITILNFTQPNIRILFKTYNFTFTSCIVCLLNMLCLHKPLEINPCCIDNHSKPSWPVTLLPWLKKCRTLPTVVPLPSYRCLERLKARNERLSAALERRKGESEQISMALSRHEADNTALQMALRYWYCSNLNRNSCTLLCTGFKFHRG